MSLPNKHRLSWLKTATVILLAGVLALGLHLAARQSPTLAATTNPCGTQSTPITVKHVIWIWEENKAETSIDSTNTPYYNTIRGDCGYSNNLMDNLYDAGPSEPQYAIATSGSNCVTGLATSGSGCITTDSDYGSSNSLSTTSIFQLLGSNWKGYAESMPSNCDRTSSSPYAYKHNPGAFYSNITAACGTQDVPVPTATCSSTVNTPCTIAGGTNALINDLNNDTLPAFSFVTPNLNNDWHDGTAGQMDNWLATYLPLIFASKAYATEHNTVVMVMTDESDSGTTIKAIPNMVIAPSVTAGTVYSPTVNNVSYLRTTEHLLGLTDYLGCASGTEPGTSTACPTGSNVDVSSAFNLAAGGGDTAPPTAAITTPAAGATVSGTITVSATASDNVGVSQVALYVDGQQQGSAVTASPYNFSLDTTKLTAGSHTLTVKAYDAAGNIGTSAGVAITVQQPTSCANPNPDTSLGTVTQTVTIPQTDTYRVWSRLNVPDTTNNSYYLQVDGGCPIDVGDASSIAANTWTWVDYQDGNTSSITSLSLSQGTHQLVMIGKESGVELDRVIFTSDTTCVPSGTGDNCANTDTTPPAVSLTAPAGGATVSGSSVSLAATASDASGISKVNFSVDGVVVGTSTVAPYSINWDSTTVANGTHTVTATAYDTAGNSATSAGASVTVNNQTQSGLPDLVVTSVSWTPASPLTGDQVIFSATIKNSGTAPTPSGTIVGIAFDVDGTEVTWSDSNTTSLAPGDSRTQTANGGKQGVAYWPATSGAHTITAWVDDVNRIPESNETNNQLSASMTVNSAAVGDINGDGTVDVQDLSIMLDDWNTNKAESDLNHDGTVDVIDLSMLLASWGQ